MARKIHSEFKAAVSLIIRENLSALKDVFTNSGNDEPQSSSQNREITQQNSENEKSEIF